MAWRISLVPLSVCLALLLAAQNQALPGVPTQVQAPPAIAESGVSAPSVAAQSAPALSVQAAQPSSAEDVAQALVRAEALRRVGEQRAAIDVLQPSVEHPDPSTSAEVRYRIALLRVELGEPREAAADLEGLLARSPRVSIGDRATFLLALARRQADDCRGAMGALSQYGPADDLLDAYVSLQLAACNQQLGDTGAALGRTTEVLERSGPRLLRVEVLERQADILEKAGDRAGALARYEQLVGLARARNYKADVRLAAARLGLELGRQAEAINHLAAVVSEVPSARNAPTALDRLVALGAQDRVSYFDAGLVRYFAGAYAAASRNFDGALATPGEAANHPASAYYRAVSRVRQGAEIEGARELLALPGQYPGSRYAPDALLRGAKVLESTGNLSEAALAYRRLANDYPASSEAREGLFRLGLASLLRSAPAEARAAWGELGASSASAELRSLGLLWRGKVESAAGDNAAARLSWQQAFDVGPNWYGGIRARSLLEGSPSVIGSPRGLDPARLEPSPDELAELNTWTSSRGASLEALAAEWSGEPSLARVDELLALGLNAEAGWELDDLAGRYAGDPARLAGLALAEHQRGLDALALVQAQMAVEAAGVAPQEAPVALQKLLYPIPYADVLVAQSGKHGVDPLLFAALVRQESHFDPRARSVANAMGLTQVVPPTAQEIARALGRTSFQIEDLYRPSVSLEFGAFYFGQRLKRFGGALFPSLAAYNAGDGSADRWIRDFGLDDADLFAERIPYSETNHYVKVILENYGLYRALYGAR